MDGSAHLWINGLNTSVLHNGLPFWNVFVPVQAGLGRSHEYRG